MTLPILELLPQSYVSRMNYCELFLSHPTHWSDNIPITEEDEENEILFIEQMTKLNGLTIETCNR